MPSFRRGQTTVFLFSISGLFTRQLPSDNETVLLSFSNDSNGRLQWNLNSLEPTDLWPHLGFEIVSTSGQPFLDSHNTSHQVGAETHAVLQLKKWYYPSEKLYRHYRYLVLLHSLLIGAGGWIDVRIYLYIIFEWILVIVLSLNSWISTLTFKYKVEVNITMFLIL